MCTADLTFNDNTTLSGTYNDAGFTAAGTTTVAGATTINAGASAITFTGTVNGPNALTLNSSGADPVTSAVGNTAALASLTTNAGGTTAINGGVVTTTGAQAYGDAVTLGAATTITGVGNTFGSTVNGAFALTVNDSGTTTYGGGTRLSSGLTVLTKDAVCSTAINGGAITTTGAQTYNDAVTLGAA